MRFCAPELFPGLFDLRSGASLDGERKARLRRLDAEHIARRANAKALEPAERGGAANYCSNYSARRRAERCEERAS